MANFNVNPEATKIIKEYAADIGVDAEEALSRLVITADSRRKALAKYAKKTAKGEKVKAAPKAKKAKGALARKQKTAKKAKAPKLDATPAESPIAVV